MSCVLYPCITLPPPPSCPTDATGPALILVGALMILNICKIPWSNVQEAVPAFLTMVRWGCWACWGACAAGRAA